jgi:iodotyrosine deiodinase
MHMAQQKIINGFPYVLHTKPFNDQQTTLKKSTDFYHWLDERRTVRDFSDKPIDIEVITNILLSASTAPSGAHKQPWTFCVVSDKNLKKDIRKAAEEEEKESYEKRMTEEWLNDLAPLGTDWHKPFLEIAPYLIVVFKRNYEILATGKKQPNYYVTESCGIACGLLLAAIHNAGLAALTHTPSPMNFLSKLLNRPENEKPFLLIPIGYLADECWVPDLKRKQISEIANWY